MRGMKRFAAALLCLVFFVQGALAYETLEQGSAGTEVSRMQRALAALGYAVGADGVYGSQTRSAVKAFQADQGLTVDGKAGNKTLTLLYALEANLSQNAVSAVPATAAGTAVGQATVYCRDGGKLNLRTGAGSGYKSIAQIPTGAAVTVLDQGSKWSAVSYNGLNGYVMTSFLQFAQTAAPAVPAVPTVTAAPVSGAEAGMQAVVVCKDNGKLNLRMTASSGSKVLERIPSGTVLTVYPAGGKWYNTSYNGQSGYVQNGFLSFNLPAATTAPAAVALPTVTPAPAAPAASAAVQAVVQCNGSLNLRSAASSGAKVLEHIPNGTPLTVTPVSDTWYMTAFNGQTGYVMARYLNLSGSAQSAVPAVPAAPAVPAVSVSSLQYEEFRYATVKSSGGLNVYKGPGTNYSRVGQVKSGTQIVVSAIVGDWCAMYYGDIQGYVQRSQVEIAASTGVAQGITSVSAGSYSTYAVDYNGNTSSAKTSAVTRAQKALRELNYNVPLTGAFEARTHDAIVAFQLRNGLTATGFLDPATQTVLYSGHAHDAAWPSRYYLSSYSGLGIAAPANVQLLHWNNEVSGLLSGQSAVTVFDPATGLSWRLHIMSRGRHLDVEPATLEDTLIQKKSFVTTSWDVHPVYVLMPDGRWTLATMHDYPHGTSTIKDNGFGGQNCVHFLRDMSEAKKNDPNYGVQNQEVLRSYWKQMTGITVE